jgi:hypothetical protein
MKKSDLEMSFLFRILNISTNQNCIYMPTLLTKDIVREAYLATDIHGRKLIITLKAGDMLSFRSKGRKISYEVPLAACFNMALIYSANEWHKQKMAEYERKRKAGYRECSIQSITKH